MSLNFPHLSDSGTEFALFICFIRYVVLDCVCVEASKPVMVYWLMRMPMHATYAGEARVPQPGSPVPL